MEESIKSNIKLCDYGCGKPAKFKIKCGGWCCEEKYQRCPGAKKKRAEKPNKRSEKYPKKIIKEKPELCERGCGKSAVYQFKNGVWGCSKNPSSCNINKDIIRQNTLGKKHTRKKIISLDDAPEKLCDYGCGKPAVYQFKNGKCCCSKNVKKCNSISIKAKRKKVKKDNPGICEYGCGLKAKFYLPSVDKWCCSKYVNNCMVFRLRRSNTLKNMLRRALPENTDQICDYGCGKQAKYLFNNGKVCCSKTYASCCSKRKTLTSWRSNLISNSKENKKFVSKLQPVVIDINTTSVCSYGCGKIGKYQLKNGKICCEKMHVWCEGFRKKISERIKLNNPMKNPETVLKNFRNHNRVKTGPEKWIEKIFNEHNFKIQYIGDGSKYINGRSPDFIIPGTKKLIETYDSSFIYSGEIRDDLWIEKRREQLHGYNVLFIDFYKLGGIQNYDKLVNIIREFYFE